MPAIERLRAVIDPRDDGLQMRVRVCPQVPPAVPYTTAPPDEPAYTALTDADPP